ncbi:hypothetical protein QP157_04220 [Sphingomonas sp. LR61]|uniref:Jag family protein n=1 Tax=Sphingomonas sp. LR61 TaxID=3050234 RepID=UPI002FE2C355
MTEQDTAAAVDTTEVPDEDARDEADIAADYIEELLDICDLDGDIEIEERAGRVYLSVTDDGEALRVLSKPDTVTALQELTRIAVQAETGEFSRLILDVGGSRDARADELQRLVDTAVERIEAGSSSAALPRCRRTSASWSTTSSLRRASTRSPRVRVGTATRSSPDDGRVGGSRHRSRAFGRCSGARG